MCSLSCAKRVFISLKGRLKIFCIVFEIKNSQIKGLTHEDQIQVKTHQQELELEYIHNNSHPSLLLIPKTIPYKPR